MMRPFYEARIGCNRALEWLVDDLDRRIEDEYVAHSPLVQLVGVVGKARPILNESARVVKTRRDKAIRGLVEAS